jgi:hypothetical protein
MKIYYIIYKFNRREQEEIYRILNDPRGWSSFGYSFLPVLNVSQADIIISKESPANMERRFTDPELHGLSVTTRYLDDTPTDIWINSKNWNSVPPDFVGSKSLYHEYVIQHEIGHALGLGHEEPIHTYTTCPVMYQQTKGTRGICASNPWISMQ